LCQTPTKEVIVDSQSCLAFANDSVDQGDIRHHHAALGAEEWNGTASGRSPTGRKNVAMVGAAPFRSIAHCWPRAKEEEMSIRRSVRATTIRTTPASRS
jgi:hypothetical protein